jgi:hypothetical protein
MHLVWYSTWMATFNIFIICLKFHALLLNDTPTVLKGAGIPIRLKGRVGMEVINNPIPI